VVVSAVAPHITVEPLTKFVPATVSVNAAPPASAEVGLREVIVGPATVNVDAEDFAPPGLCTVMLSAPVLAIRVGGSVAVIDVEVPAVTASAVAPQYTSEPDTKFPPPSVTSAIKLAPVTVIAAADAPATTGMGLTDEIVGPSTANVLAAEEAALEFFTVTRADPAAASWVLVTAAVSEVVLPGVVRVVVNGVEPHSTVEPPTKLIPVTVSVKAAPPAAVAVGLSAVIAGPLTVKSLAADEAALEFFTVTLCEPAEASWALVTAAVSEVALP